MKMTCFRCGGQVFDFKADARVEQNFKGDTLFVVCPAMVCRKCQAVELSPDQLDQLRRLTADTYRTKHGLLTSSDIRRLRTDRGMSQAKFAEFLCVGEASVKRWETWLVQEKSSDQLIRLKCGI